MKPLPPPTSTYEPDWENYQKPPERFVIPKPPMIIPDVVAEPAKKEKIYKRETDVDRGIYEYSYIEGDTIIVRPINQIEYVE